MQKSILVVGSINTDMVVKSGSIPTPGETVLGGDFLMTPGGKGANQAVAAAKLGGEVIFIANVGDDMFGHKAIRDFKDYGIDTQAISIDKNEPSGVALIMVDDQGENCISVALGANATLGPDSMLVHEQLIKGAQIVLVQLETPLETVDQLAKLASKYGVKLILNPAPAQSLDATLLQSVSIITPNETEAELLTGVTISDSQSAAQSAQVLHDQGVDTVIITMGASGAFVSSSAYTGLVPTVATIAVDTTAAGDTFNGGLAVGLASGKSLHDAVVFANKAAALSVTKIGAQSSIPNLEEVMNS